MALRNVPFRSEVLAWDPDSLADYFRKVSVALCWWRGWQCPWWRWRWRWRGAGQRLEDGVTRRNVKGRKDSGETPDLSEASPFAGVPVPAPLRVPGDEIWGEAEWGTQINV